MKIMNTYRISDTATSDEVNAPTLNDAVAKYLKNYATAEMEKGDTFTARVFTGEGLMDLAAVVTVTADGKSGVETYEIVDRW